MSVVCVKSHTSSLAAYCAAHCTGITYGDTNAMYILEATYAAMRQRHEGIVLSIGRHLCISKRNLRGILLDKKIDMLEFFKDAHQIRVHVVRSVIPYACTYSHMNNHGKHMRLSKTAESAGLESFHDLFPLPCCVYDDLNCQRTKTVIFVSNVL